MSAPRRSARSATILAYEILTARNEFEACLISSAIDCCHQPRGQRRIRASRWVYRAFKRSLQHRAVNILQLPLGGFVFHTYDDAVGVQKILDCRALAQEFRIRCNAERYTGFATVYGKSAFHAFEQILPETRAPGEDPLDQAQLRLLALWKEKQLVGRRLLAYDTTNLHQLLTPTLPRPTHGTNWRNAATTSRAATICAKWV